VGRLSATRQSPLQPKNCILDDDSGASSPEIKIHLEH
jgi:hypothetical protein